MARTESVRVQMFVAGSKRPVRVLEVGGVVTGKQLSSLDERLRRGLTDIGIKTERMPSNDGDLFCYMLSAKKWNVAGAPGRVEEVIATYVDTTYGIS